MRDCAGLLGVNVTLPHKLEIMEYVDIIDAGAARVRAVNTVVRAENGKLIGYNTDGEGFIESILKPQPGQRDSFLESLADMNVLLLGAGGSAHAVALQVAEQLNRGQLLICNRTLEHAQGLAAEIGKVGLRASVVLEAQLPERACTVGLIVNSTTKGQGGLRRPEPGTVTTMEPYSALAPAHPVAVPEFEYGKPDSQEKTAQAFQSDVQKNNEASMKLAASVPKSVRFYDLIYSPEETVFLRHGRLTGHPTMNGKAMLINQAVIGFCKRICHAELQARGLHEPEVYQRVLAAMYGAW
jgi:shikimate 5-dehydrogenase